MRRGRCTGGAAWGVEGVCRGRRLGGRAWGNRVWLYTRGGERLSESTMLKSVSGV